VDHTPRVGAVYLEVICRVANLQLRQYSFKTVVFEQRKHIAPRRIGDCGHIVDALRKGVDIHHRAAYDDAVIQPARLHIGYEAQGVLLEAGGAVIFVEFKASRRGGA